MPNGETLQMDYSSMMIMMMKQIKDQIGKEKIVDVNTELNRLGLKIDEIKKIYRDILKEETLWRS